jgi:preprotein translocase subunit SecD
MKYIIALFCALILLSCTDKTAGKPIASVAVIEFRAASLSPDQGYAEMTTKDSEQKIYVSEEVLLTNADIASAAVIFSEVDSGPEVGLKMTESGKTKLEKITEQNLYKPIGILVDKQLVSAPVVQEKITGGMLKISGIASIVEATRIADEINGK